MARNIDLDRTIERPVERHGLKDVLLSMCRYCEEQAFDAEEPDGEDVAMNGGELGNWTLGSFWLSEACAKMVEIGIGDGWVEDEEDEAA